MTKEEIKQVFEEKYNIQKERMQIKICEAFSVPYGALIKENHHHALDKIHNEINSYQGISSAEQIITDYVNTMLINVLDSFTKSNIEYLKKRNAWIKIIYLIFW